MFKISILLVKSDRELINMDSRYEKSLSLSSNWIHDESERVKCMKTIKCLKITFVRHL